MAFAYLATEDQHEFWHVVNTTDEHQWGSRFSDNSTDICLACEQMAC